MIRSLVNAFFSLTNWIRETLIVAWLWLPHLSIARKRPVIPLVVSLTSHPGRIRRAWLSIETLLRQSVQPQALLLVLSEAEFPEKLIPSSLHSQTRRGLSILWVTDDNRSFDKLLPVRREHPNATIVTFDDDKYFPLTILDKLHKAARAHPASIVGARGWRIRPAPGNGVHYGENWERLRAPAEGKDLLMPGGNGCLYPPNSLADTVDDVSAALVVCPTADDIWFWGAAQQSGTSSFCLGLPAHRPVGGQKKTSALSDVNHKANDRQFQNALDYFNLRNLLSEMFAPTSQTTPRVTGHGV